MDKIIKNKKGVEVFFSKNKSIYQWYIKTFA